MSDDKEMAQEQDFAVLHGLSRSASSVFKVFSELKNRCKPSVLRGRTLPNESLDDFLLRVAISSTSGSSTLYRKAETANDALALVWLALVKDRATSLCLNRDIAFPAAFTEKDLRDVTRLSQDPSMITKLPEILAERYGIILVVEKYLPAMKLDGCVFKLINGVPVIGISARYNRYDNFWFTLSHELAHIVLHYESLDSPIVDDFDQVSDSEVEVEANRLATDSLIPRNVLRKIMLNQGSLKRVVELSNEAECHPAIAAGMIRHRTGQWTLYSELVNFMDVRSELGLND
ncbi:ImmA/IrrE family metallo-endopeptidase [Pseudomonas sp. Irchel 3E19]|uniref:ImmA/IrrE family metallo-endopeptidase n=1 Tax=Pseudomonas sp. Irchel 3E19 TaxID=2008981 RepID=UPI000BA3D66E|nr:ImmA/IrrE family metallo-endopeptidase [Pseudomonas sp. Irchel 3E19]